MGTYFRRSMKLLPGVRLNFSKRGVGLSMGVRGAHYSISPTGRRTVSGSVPGTGFGFRKSISSGKSSRDPSPTGYSTPLRINYAGSALLAGVRFAAWTLDILLGLAVIGGALIPDFSMGQSRSSKLMTFILCLVVAALLWMSRGKSKHPNQQVESDSSLEELEKELAISLDLQRKVAAAHAKTEIVDADFHLALDSGEVGFYQCEAIYFDPKKPDYLDDFGTVWITSERVVFSSMETSKEWKFENLNNIIQPRDPHITVFAVSNRQRNSGVKIHGDVTDFENYLHSAMAAFNPRFTNVDLDKVISESISDLQREISLIKNPPDVEARSEG